MVAALRYPEREATAKGVNVARSSHGVVILAERSGGKAQVKESGQWRRVECAIAVRRFVSQG